VKIPFYTIPGECDFLAPFLAVVDRGLVMYTAKAMIFVFGYPDHQVPLTQSGTMTLE